MASPVATEHVRPGIALLRDTLRHRIAEARRHSGLSRDDLGDLVGVAGRSVRRWEEGERVPSLVELCKLAVFTDTSLLYLLWDVEEKREAIAREAANGLPA